jgi:hypothetical protein
VREREKIPMRRHHLNNEWNKWKVCSHKSWTEVWILTGYLPDASQTLYHHVNMLDFMKVYWSLRSTTKFIVSGFPYLEDKYNCVIVPCDQFSIHKPINSTANNGQPSEFTRSHSSWPVYISPNLLLLSTNHQVLERNLTAHIKISVSSICQT